MILDELRASVMGLRVPEHRSALEPTQFEDFDDGGGGSDSGGLNFESGQQVIDLNTGQLLRVGVGNQGQITIFDPQTQQLFPSGLFTTLTGDVFNLQNSQVVGDPRALTDRERQALGLRGSAGGGGGGGGAGGTQSFASTQAGAEFEHQARIEELREQARLADASGQTARADQLRNDIRILEEQQKFQKSENKLSRENTTRNTLLSSITNLAGTLATIQQQAKALTVETLGKDPFRGAALAQGGVSTPTNSFQQFRDQLQQTASIAPPDIDPSASIGQLQEQFGDLSGQVSTGVPQPSALAGSGLAMGGTIDMRRGGDGGFSMAPDAPGTVSPISKGTAGYGVLVGDGTINGDEEVLHIKNDGGVEVIPLVGGAQEGISIAPEQVGNVSPLGGVFRHLGFDSLPFTRPNRGSFVETFGIGDTGGQSSNLNAADTFKRLGIQPRLLRDQRSGRVFFRGEDGRLGRIADMDALRNSFDPREVVNFSGSDIADVAGIDRSQFGTGQRAGDIARQTQNALGPDVTSQSLVPDQLNTGIAPRPAPLIEPGSGLLLPAPEMISSIFRTLPKVVQNLLFSVWGEAELPMSEAIRRLELSTPTGTAQLGQTAGLA